MYGIVFHTGKKIYKKFYKQILQTFDIIIESIKLGIPYKKQNPALKHIFPPIP